MQQLGMFDSAKTKTPRITLNPDGTSVKGCSIIYAPKGQAGEYAPLSANLYRGCSHACVYCLDGTTLIQMANGTTKPISQIEIGDSVIGIVNDGRHGAWSNRIVTTQVLAKVQNHKPAYKITLADGTEVICSADHRWLTERGWKYTTGAMSGNNQRPYLTTNNFIRQLSTATLTPQTTKSYKAGYLAGMIQGDANLAIYDYSHRRRPSGKTMGVQYRFRLALKDEVALQRTKTYLTEFGIQVNDFTFKDNKNGNLAAIQTTSPDRYRAIEALTEHREDPEWLRGWLAGIFDAEGSHGNNALRISNTDESILLTTEIALSALDFDFVREPSTPERADVIRVLGGRYETTRFWQLTNPCISRKFNLENNALRGQTKIVSIEQLNETREMYDIMTGTENFIANGLVSHNCYVPAVLRMSRQEFDAAAIPRPDIINKLRKDAARYQDAGITEQVMMSFTTDPYNPFDTNLKLTRQAIEILINAGLGFCTLTKGGNRALRDIDMFRPDRDAFATTLTSLDDSVSIKWESGAALPADRIDTLRRFHDAGIFTWVSLEPVYDTEMTLQIIEATHEFVDLYKIGRINYHKLTKQIDWQEFTHRAVDLFNELDAAHYVKQDLQPYLPDGYENIKRLPQHN